MASDALITVVQVASIVLGWIVVHRLSAKRDRDKERREMVVEEIDALDAKARVEEVARMLGGTEITETTRKHARELLAS
jgi:DNA repair ATPase RecN